MYSGWKPILYPYRLNVVVSGSASAALSSNCATLACPGFSADCLETLEELGIRGRESFVHSGGDDFAHARRPDAGHRGDARIPAAPR